MCGLTGIFTSRPFTRESLEEAVRTMASTLVHRGPDDPGHWTDPSVRIALGFRRLSILDLTPEGHQPMKSASERFVVVFNGEVYNYRELRLELEGFGVRFHGRSDTEVVLAAFERWGIAGAAGKFVGMFAMAVWDTRHRSLTLIRDRLGIKPLFVYAEPGFVAFGSELKALVAGPSFDRSIDLAALGEYLRYLFVPAPRTIYQRASKLLPGHMLTVTDPDRPLPASSPYWSVEAEARSGCSDPFDGSDVDAIEELDRLLAEAVRVRMRADVPVGALLSGGIDSSAVVAAMQATAQRPVKTFSIGFLEKDHNEAHHAASVARHLGTDHTELVCTGDDALALVPRIPDWFDEPHADPSQLPTFLVSQLARRAVTVALSGDGGDEVFAGYNRYAYGARLLPAASRLPVSARRLIAAGIERVPPGSWDRVHDIVATVLPPRLRQRGPGEKLHKIGDLMSADSVVAMYQSLMSAWKDPTEVVVNGASTAGVLERIMEGKTPKRLIDRMMLADQLVYLPDDLLAKVDRVSMAVSLEVRLPLLDHRVVEFAWRLPARFKLRKGVTKWILRQVLYRRVPRTLIDRPKMGFTVPIDAWLRGPLREWGRDLLSEDQLRMDGLLRPQPVLQAWDALQAGKRETGLALWAVLVFQSWRNRWSSPVQSCPVGP